MKILKKVTPAPVIEAVTEIRFKNELPSAVLFGKLYGSLSESFPKTEPLPILEMPSQIIEKQPELKFAPHYRLRNDRFIVNVGQRMISINRLCTEVPYEDWPEYFECIKSVLEVVSKVSLFTVADETSIRYINFFKEQVATVLNLEIGLSNEKVDQYSDLKLSLTRSLEDGTSLGFNVASNAKVELGENLQDGLVVNIEAKKKSKTKIDELITTIDSLHASVRSAFSASLKEDFIATLEPQYEQ
jgi:uncharacterized protein (TIGR04255 family)